MTTFPLKKSEGHFIISVDGDNYIIDTGSPVSCSFYGQMEVAIGDRKFDVEGAQAMRLVSVAVTYGFAQGDELVLAKPDYIVQTVDELQRILLQ